jgi:hypothetical protein
LDPSKFQPGTSFIKRSLVYSAFTSRPLSLTISHWSRWLKILPSTTELEAWGSHCVAFLFPCGIPCGEPLMQMSSYISLTAGSFVTSTFSGRQTGKSMLWVCWSLFRKLNCSAKNWGSPPNINYPWSKEVALNPWRPSAVAVPNLSLL